MMKRRRLILPVIVVILHTSGGCAHEVRQPPPQPTEADLRQLQKVAEAARKALNFVVWEFDEGQRPMTPQLIEERYVWSRRLATAKVALARTREEQLSMVGAHLEEMKRLDGMVRGRLHRQHRDDVGMTEFYVAEAELWLERVKRE